LRCAQENYGAGDQKFPGGRVHHGLQHSLVDWLECRRSCLCVRKQKPGHARQRNGRHNSGGKHPKFGSDSIGARRPAHILSKPSSALKQVNDQDNDGNYEQEMDQTATNVSDKTKKPEHDQDDNYSPKHRIISFRLS
jgi:hypothetical protein